MNPAWCDAHCHLSDSRIFQKAPDLIERAKRVGVKRFVLGGTDPLEWQRQLDLKARFPGAVLCSFGLHPWWVSEQAQAEKVTEALKTLGRMVDQADFIGETGLDFHPRWKGEGLRLQQLIALQAQLDLAASVKKPLVLHVVRAHKEMLQILSTRQIQGERVGLVHSFSGSKQEAAAYLDRGFYLSLSGGYLKNPSLKSKEMIQSLPLNQIVIETDSPDQAWDEKPNEPSRIIEIAKGLSEVMMRKPEEILEQSARNIEYLCKK